MRIKAETAVSAAAIILAAGVAATLIIISLRPWSPYDPELIGVVATLAAAEIGAVGGYLARHHDEHQRNEALTAEPPAGPPAPPGTFHGR